MFRVRGDLLSATGDRAAAEESYHRALAVARSQTAKTLELRAATSLARLCALFDWRPSLLCFIQQSNAHL